MSPSSANDEIFATRLRAVRELRGLSQAQLAAKTGLQPAAISHFETGGRRPSFDNLRRLATALQITTDYLLGRVDDVDAQPTADAAFRDYQKLGDRDREMIQNLIGQMSARKAPSGKGGGGGEGT